METTVHDKLESIRGQVGSREAKSLIKKIDKNGAEMYDLLGLGFAVECIYSNKRSSKHKEDEREKNLKIQALLAMRNKQSSKASLAKEPHQSSDRLEYEKNITHDEVKQNYFENIYNC